jgi:hypothetical protein
MPGSNNDINVLDSSPVFSNLMNGITPRCEYTVNGKAYHRGYYLAHGIYPDYSTLIKTISQPQGLERQVSLELFFSNSVASLEFFFLIQSH